MGQHVADLDKPTRKLEKIMNTQYPQNAIQGLKTKDLQRKISPYGMAV